MVVVGQIIKVPSNRLAICIEIDKNGVSIRYLDDGSWTYLPFKLVR